MPHPRTSVGRLCSQLPSLLFSSMKFARLGQCDRSGFFKSPAAATVAFQISANAATAKSYTGVSHCMMGKIEPFATYDLTEVAYASVSWRGSLLWRAALLPFLVHQTNHFRRASKPVKRLPASWVRRSAKGCLKGGLPEAAHPVPSLGSLRIQGSDCVFGRAWARLEESVIRVERNR